MSADEAPGDDSALDLANDPRATAIKALFSKADLAPIFQFKIRKVPEIGPDVDTAPPLLRSQYSLTRLKLNPELVREHNNSSSEGGGGSSSSTAKPSSDSNSSDSVVYEGAFHRMPQITTSPHHSGSSATVAKEIVRIAFSFTGSKSSNACSITFCGHDLEIRVDDITESPEVSKSNARIAKIVLAHVKLHVEEQQRLRRPGKEDGIHKFVKHETDLLHKEDQERIKIEEEKERREKERLAAKQKRDSIRRGDRERLELEAAMMSGDESGGKIEQRNYFEEMGITSVPEILIHVFDAADEDLEGLLKHCDVLKLLEASLCFQGVKTFGVTPWDVRLILATADEDDNGLISYIPWLRGIKDVYDNIRQRREEYKKRFPQRQIDFGAAQIAEKEGTLNNPDIEGSLQCPVYLQPSKLQEVIELLQGEELTETARLLIDACVQADLADNERHSRHSGSAQVNQGLYQGGGLGSDDMGGNRMGLGHSATGFIKRATLTSILRARAERMSGQEVRILMQLVDETVVDDQSHGSGGGGGGSTGKKGAGGHSADGSGGQHHAVQIGHHHKHGGASSETGALRERVLVNYEHLRETLVRMRIEKLMNPVLESDIKVIRKEICLCVRREQIEEFVPIWTWRNILMKLDKLALSRFQIHILLCVIPSMDTMLGLINVAQAVQISVTMIERFFNPETMYETVGKIQQSLEAEAKEKELRELQEMSGQAGREGKNNAARSKSKEGGPGAAQAGNGEEYQFVDLALRDNKDEIEKNLLMLFQSVDEEKNGYITARDFIKSLCNTDWESGLTNGGPGSGLTDAEKRGFIGEAVMIANDNEEVKFKYAEHVRTWVPLIFEFRKNHLYKKMLEVDNVFINQTAATGVNENPAGFIPLLSLVHLEKEMPLFGGGLFKGGVGSKQVRKRRNSKGMPMGDSQPTGPMSSKERRRSTDGLGGGGGDKAGAKAGTMSMHVGGAHDGKHGKHAPRSYGIRGPGSKQQAEKKPSK